MPASQMGENQFQTEWQDQQTRVLESLRYYSYCWFTTSGKRAFALWKWRVGGWRCGCN